MTEKIARYKSLRLYVTVAVLIVWASVSYVLGVLLVVPLNGITFGGQPLGFWFATEGAVYLFVLTMFAYCGFMAGLDRKFDVQE